MATPKPIVIDKELTYSEKAEGQFMPTAAQSLMESLCRDYPKSPCPKSLLYIVKEQPGLYSTFLGKLIAGSSFKAACLSVGLNAQNVRNWLQQGAADLADDNDTYCGRLLLDMQRAYAMAVSDAEERVHKNSPDKWLGKGHAVEFHKGKYWQDRVKGEPMPESIEEEDPLDPIPLRIEEENPEEQETGEQELQEALKILEVHSIIDDPEFVKQARNQFRLPSPGEKDD